MKHFLRINWRAIDSSNLHQEADHLSIMTNIFIVLKTKQTTTEQVSNDTKNPRLYSYRGETIECCWWVYSRDELYVYSLGGVVIPPNYKCSADHTSHYVISSTTLPSVLHYTTIYYIILSTDNISHYKIYCSKKRDECWVKNVIAWWIRWVNNDQLAETRIPLCYLLML